MEELSQFADAADLDGLRQLQQQINEYLRDQAERQGVERPTAAASSSRPRPIGCSSRGC